ncbi:MAG: cupin domain-containing protein [Burkholderiales bacterium]|nr:cupin domain-containing protein [Burkholderiales bacterium]
MQDTQHFSRRAEALLAQFAFIPHVRVDDLMVSLAAAGGGVGPHVDSYDVFLIQGHGRRRWRISGQSDTRFRPGLPLKILRDFRPEEEWVLESGDMLYLPPGYAHEGVALDECLTYSVGFRAPTHQEWVESFLDQLRDHVCVDGQYADQNLTPTSHPGEIPASIIGKLGSILKAARWSREDVARAAGRFLTEPKSHVMFDPPEQEPSPAEFKRACARFGLRLDGRTRIAYRGNDLFINGEAVRVHAGRDGLLKQLADLRALPPCKPIHSELEQLHAWHGAGFLHVRND